MGSVLLVVAASVWVQLAGLMLVIRGEHGGTTSTTDFIHVNKSSSCDLTRYPGLCRQALLELDNNHNLSHTSSTVAVLSALVTKTISETNLSYSSHFTTQLEISQSSASGYCKRVTEMSVKRLHQSLSAITSRSPTKHKQDIQTWLSSVLTFHEACRDAISTTTSTSTTSTDLSLSHISDSMDYLTQLASNALALANTITTAAANINNIVGEYPKWVLPTKQDVIVKADAVVAKDGTGDYRTVSAAINAAAAGRRFVIYVKAGTYVEKIHTNKEGITLVGDGKYATIIAGSDSVKGGFSMPDSATFIGNMMMRALL